MSIQEGISYEINQSKINETLKVLIDRKENGSYIGRTEFDSPEVDNEVIITPAENQYLRIGDFVNVKIQNADAYDLTAILAE
jgi:ribosomal protein S12 methylthiotransferase